MPYQATQACKIMERTVFFMQSVSLTLALAVLTSAFATCSANTGKEARVSFAAPVKNDKHWSRRPGYEAKRNISSLT